MDLSEELFRGYEDEARRSGVSVESLVEQTVNRLFHQWERDLKDGDDHPITF